MYSTFQHNNSIIINLTKVNPSPPYFIIKPNLFCLLRSLSTAGSSVFILSPTLFRTIILVQYTLLYSIHIVHYMHIFCIQPLAQFSFLMSIRGE